MSFMTYSKWKPWTWLRQIRYLTADQSQAKKFVRDIEKVLHAHGYRSSDTILSRLELLAVEKAYWENHYKASEAKLAMLMKRAINIQIELNEVSNKHLGEQPDTLSLTKKNEESPRHMRVSTMADWKSLEQLQKETKRLDNERQD
jgi:hypothetical protein